MKKIFKKSIAFMVTTAVSLSFLAGLTLAARGTFTSTDALNILRHTVGNLELNAEQKARYDLNNDGAINTADALAALRIAVGATGQTPPTTTPPTTTAPLPATNEPPPGVYETPINYVFRDENISVVIPRSAMLQSDASLMRNSYTLNFGERLVEYNTIIGENMSAVIFGFGTKFTKTNPNTYDWMNDLIQVFVFTFSLEHQLYESGNEYANINPSSVEGLGEPDEKILSGTVNLTIDVTKYSGEIFTLESRAHLIRINGVYYGIFLVDNIPDNENSKLRSAFDEIIIDIR